MSKAERLEPELIIPYLTLEEAVSLREMIRDWEASKAEAQGQCTRRYCTECAREEEARRKREAYRRDWNERQDWSKGEEAHVSEHKEEQARREADMAVRGRDIGRQG